MRDSGMHRIKNLKETNYNLNNKKFCFWYKTDSKLFEFIKYYLYYCIKYF